MLAAFERRQLVAAQVLVDLGELGLGAFEVLNDDRQGLPAERPAGLEPVVAAHQAQRGVDHDGLQEARARDRVF
ncbi:MAG TPA: hypothetical protein VFS00_11355, partial [Polyangiaceae bacterium]|nr:hypothetical protein [Polyangiaceae bacterium]